MVSDYLAYLVQGKGSGSNDWDLYQVESYYGGEKALPPLSLLGY